MNTTIKILVMIVLIIGLAFFSILSGPALMLLCGHQVPGWDFGLIEQERRLTYFIFSAWSFTLAGLIALSATPVHGKPSVTESGLGYGGHP